jgi:hypothetical protein
MRADTGWVFIDREFVPGPYVVREDGDALLINGQRVARARDDSRGRQGEPRFLGPRPGDDPRFVRSPWPRRPGMGGPRPMLDRGAAWVVHTLKDKSVVFASTDEPLVVFDDLTAIYLFKVLTGHRDKADALETVLDALPPHEDPQEWKQWLASYTMPPALQSDARGIVKQVDDVETRNEAAAAAVRRLNTLAYPLTVLGMVAAVLALGHLLRSLPKAAHEEVSEGQLAELRRACTTSTGLVAVLSALDLVWTILASQAGQMTELNPLGSRLIDDPLTLAAFKVTATLISCSLLFALRGHAAAQRAAWWLCLVCTVLTFRWLVMNSLFVGS